MFHTARIKLTVWYLGIIMLISLAFSGVIYVGVNRELTRIQDYQRVRLQRIINGIPAPFDIPVQDVDAIAEARARIILSLGLINLSILVISGLGGYLLAGQTLKPIAKMVNDQKEFVSNASHELRTPLTSLKTEIEVAIRDKKLSLGEARSLLKSNLEDVNKMQKLSNYLLELNSYGSVTNLNFSSVNLKTVAEKAIEMAKSLAEAKKIKITSKLVNSFVKGDEDSLVELTTILLDNAIKYSGHGKEVVVATGKNGQISVQDFGIGIAKEDLPNIFDRFFRADVSRSKEKIDGYGLGLSIAKSIVDLHGGRIEVVSKENKGTTFTVTI